MALKGKGAGNMEHGSRKKQKGAWEILFCHGAGKNNLGSGEHGNPPCKGS